MWHFGLRVWVSGFGFPVLDFDFFVSCVRLRASDHEARCGSNLRRIEVARVRPLEHNNLRVVPKPER